MMNAPCSSVSLKSVLWTLLLTLLKRNALYTSFVSRQAQVMVHVMSYFYFCMTFVYSITLTAVHLCIRGGGSRTTRVRSEWAELDLLPDTPGATTKALRAWNNAKNCFGNNGPGNLSSLVLCVWVLVITSPPRPSVPRFTDPYHTTSNQSPSSFPIPSSPNPTP
jgi:hypothetical protein